MAYPWSAHDALTASDLNAAIALALPNTVVKSADEAVTSSTTLQDDNELLVSLTAGRTYCIEAFLLVTGLQAGDVKIAWGRTGTLNHTGGRMCTGPGLNTTDVAATAAAATTVGTTRASGGHALTTAISYGTDAAASSAIHEQFILQAAVTGTLTLQWAQNASSATPTTMKAGSWLKVTVVE